MLGVIAVFLIFRSQLCVGWIPIGYIGYIYGLYWLYWLVSLPQLGLPPVIPI